MHRRDAGSTGRHANGGPAVAAHLRRQQVSPQTAIALLEQVWGRDLSAYDPDGPLPDVDPDPGGSIVQGRVRQHQDALATANRWREQAEAEHLSIRELMIRVSGSSSLVGTPAQVAAEMDEYVQEDATDGFVMIGHLTPGGLDDVTNRVIPELQERGSFRTAYRRAPPCGSCSTCRRWRRPTACSPRAAPAPEHRRPDEHRDGHAAADRPSTRNRDPHRNRDLHRNRNDGISAGRSGV